MKKTRTKKSFKFAMSALAFTAVLIFSGMSLVKAATTSKTYFYKTGDIDGINYVLSLTGNSVALTGTTFYNRSNCTRSVSVTAKYVGSSFTGTRTLQNSNGNGYGQASITLYVPTVNDRFTSATSTHFIDGWTYTNSSPIY